MNDKISELFINQMFECDSYACHCMKDIENISPGEEPLTTLKMYSDPAQPLHFAYSSKEGLNLTGSAGGKMDTNILGKLLSIPQKDLDRHIEFFEKYGFFRPLSIEEYSSINADSILAVANHVKATIRLLNGIAKHDYKSMLIHASYLLFSEPVEYACADMSYMTCPHPFTQQIFSNPPFPDMNQDREVQVTGAYSVNDTILGSKNHVQIEFINAIRSGMGTDIPGSKSSWFKNIVALYLLSQNINEELRLIIDFYYHLFTEVAIFEEVEYSKIKPYSTMELDKLSDSMKDALVKISRIVAAEEINYNIQGIHPKYNGQKLTASWQVDTLIEALYFSIFYMKAGVEIYKECENPNCKRDKYFLVEATRTNKKYCCQQCANAAAAQRHRNKKL